MQNSNVISVMTPQEHYSRVQTIRKAGIAPLRKSKNSQCWLSIDGQKIAVSPEFENALREARNLQELKNQDVCKKPNCYTCRTLESGNGLPQGFTLRERMFPLG